MFGRLRQYCPRFTLFVLWALLPLQSSVAAVEEWLDHGFSRHEAHIFDAARFSIPEAQMWLKHVFSAGQAVDWKRNGFTLKEAETWREYGILGGYNARKLIQHGYTLDRLHQWHNLGAANLAMIRRLRQANFTLKTAKKWSGLGYSPNDWIAFVKHGYDYEDAKQWRALGFASFIEIRELTRLGFDLKQATEWRAAGIPYDEWYQWKQYDFDMDEITEWISEGVSNPRTAHRLRQSGIGVESVAAWSKISRSFVEWLNYHRLGLSPAEAQQWHDAGVGSASQAEQYLSLGLTPDDVRAWRNAGVKTIHELTFLLDAGIVSPEQKRRWDALGVTNAPRWVFSGIEPSEAARWIANGVNNVDTVVRYKKQGVSPDEVPHQWKIPLVAWGVAGLIVMLVIFVLSAYWEELLVFSAWCYKRFKPIVLPGR